MEDIELGVLEKRIRKPRRPQLVILFITLVQLGLCLVFFNFYDVMFNMSSHGTAGLVGAAMSGLSQSLLQLLTKKYNYDAIVKFQVWGVMNGIWTRFWTELLSTTFSRWPIKVLLDQAFGNPFAVFAFTSLSAFWEGYDIDLYLQKNYFQALKVSLLIWPIASFLQFIVIPEKYIVLFNTVVNFAWIVILGLLM